MGDASARSLAVKSGRAAGFLVGALGGACATYNPHVAATPTPAATTDFAVTADVLVVDRGLGPELFAAPDVAVRRGLGGDWDLGLRLFPLGGEFSARGRLVAAPGYELTLQPLLAGGLVTFTNADTSLFATGVGLGALNDFRLSERTELTFGLRSGLEVGLNAVAVREDFSAARFRVLGGASLALAHRVGERFSLSPGAIVLVPYDLEHSEAGFPIVQGGVAASW
jgi:hypothetical protein